ncbi:MAG: thioredoxin domain-containing protein [Hyphomicrobiaceae bacterium]
MSENRLARETSPYLLQHKDNPVHWWAWGPEALAEARATGKPILLSVGYAACHWCHVMAHESFEDPATAAVMNDLFVNIKVDREERPDIDAIYMAALHKLDEQGGWPLTMFLDTEAKPFWGGTYFPPEPRWGRPGFRQVLTEVARIFREEPAKVRHNADAITAALATQAPAGGVSVDDAVLRDLTQRLVGAVDPALGGLRGAPKFPQWNIFWLLWRGAIRYGHAPARRAVEVTLDGLCQGGIYDHLGGGFARYSVDERWLVPHFEKMLYDNALLIDLMTEVWRETAAPLLAQRVRETAEWVLRDMRVPGGGFAASFDADSEGEEGKFYVWTPAQIAEVLGADDARIFSAAYDVTAEGNFEGHAILNRLHVPAQSALADENVLAPMRAKLLAARAKRIPPGWDDKVLADWNGLMIAALARAGEVFARPDWIEAAAAAFAFVVGNLGIPGDKLLHAFRDGRAKAPATASDYANMIWGALRLHQATGAADYLEQARRWTATLDARYWDDAAGGYNMTADDTPDVIVRLRAAHDDATPNANAIMITNLVQLALLTGDSRYADRAAAIPQAFAGDIARSAPGHSGLLANAMDVISPQQVVVVGAAQGTDALAQVMRTVSLPGALQQVIDAGATMPATPALAGKTAQAGLATAYVCVGPQCSAPITDALLLAQTLRAQRAAPSA